MSSHSTAGLSRRAFLAASTTSVALAGCATKMNTARVVPHKVSPNEKLNIAGIGVGGKGLGDIMSCTSENIVALCDVDWKRAEEAFYKLPKAKQFKDFRVMLEEMDQEIDACVISTPDHTHASAAYMAMNMGKHVRVQKPLTHTIAEARLLQRTARECGVVNAMGNQGHSQNGIRDLCEMLWSGAIGDVTEVRIWTDRPFWPQAIRKPLPERPVPPTMDWDLWLGPAPERGYNKGYAPFKWRGWWDFGCGAIGDMACHIMDAAFWSLQLKDAKTYSVEVLMEKGLTKETPPAESIIKYEFPARGAMPPVTLYWYDGQKNIMPRPEGLPADEQLGEGPNGSLFIGTDGYLTTGCYANDSRLLPAERMKDYKRPPQILPRIPGGNSYKNWIHCCKTGEVASSNFDYAAPLTEVANMGNIALRVGEKIVFDVEKMEITNVKSANQFLTKEYRKGWELPC